MLIHKLCDFTAHLSLKQKIKFLRHLYQTLYPENDIYKAIHNLRASGKTIDLDNPASPTLLYEVGYKGGSSTRYTK